MRIDRIIIMTAVLAFVFGASACIFSPSQDEVGSKNMQMEKQASGLGSEGGAGVDVEAKAEAEADAEAEAKAEAEDRGNTPPLEVTTPLRPIGGREDIPLSIGDISIIVEGSLDTTAVIGSSYWEQFTAFSSVNPNMYFMWTVTGLPPGLSYSISGSYNQNVTIEGAPTSVASYPITLKAAQWADSTNFAEYPYTLAVSAEGEEEEEEEEEGDCSVPISLEIEEIKNHNGDKLELDNDSYPVFLGTRGHEIKFKASGSKKPYTFTWSSAVKDTHKCWKKGDEVDLYEENWTWVNADKKTCDTDIYNYSSPSWTQNLSWKPAGDLEMHQVPISDCSEQCSQPRAYYAETDSNYFTLRGDIVFTDPGSGVQGPLPYIPGKYSTSPDNLDLIPEDEFTVSVKGSCDGGGGRASTASKTITYKLKHHEDMLKDAKIKIYYKDAATSNLETYDADPPYCTVDKCNLFERAHLLLFFMGDNETTVDDIYIEDDPDSEDNGHLIYGDANIRSFDDVFHHANAYARIKMQSLEDGGGVVEKDFYGIDDTATVLDARDLYLRNDNPPKVEDGALWTDSTNNDNINITRIEIETDQWIMIANDVPDLWNWDGTEIDSITHISEVREVTRNSNGGLFKRKNWTYYPLY